MVHGCDKSSEWVVTPVQHFHPNRDLMGQVANVALGTRGESSGFGCLTGAATGNGDAGAGAQRIPFSVELYRMPGCALPGSLNPHGVDTVTRRNQGQCLVESRTQCT